MFSMSDRPQFGGSWGARPALTFKAGKMVKNGTTVSADKRKGLVQIHQGQGFFNFRWVERGSQQPEADDDIMVFPDEAKYFRVEKCTSGRVYVLQFQGQDGTAGREYFIWMQEPSTEKDEHYESLINSFIKNPHRAAAGAAESAGAGQSRSQGGRGRDWTDMARGQRAGQQGSGGDAPQNRIELENLESILQNLMQQGGGAAPAAAAPAPAAVPSGAPKADVQLTDLFQRDDVRQVLSGDLSDFEGRLSEHFPEGIETSVLEEIRTPQFRQTLSMLQAALSDPAALTELTKAFDLPPCEDATKGGVERFLHSILAINKKKEEEKKE